MTVVISQNVCSVCNKTFNYKRELKQHKKECHAENDVIQECKQCRKEFSHKNYLQTHIKFAHTNDPEHGICDQCDKTFLNEHKLLNHVRNTHKPKEFVCQHCNYEFKIQSSLKEHINRAHLKLKNVSCEKCDYKGYAAVDLSTHNKNKHSDIKPYKCSLCPMAFTRLTGLYQHQETHKNAQKFVTDNPCSICQKMFKSKKGSKRCVKRHEMEGDFECTIDGCSTKFTNMINYKGHQRRQHFGGPDKKIPCNNCDMAFTTKQDLKRHIFYMHETREKIIPCSKCPKMFISKQRLGRHLLTHNSTMFKCPHEGCNVTRKLKFAINFHFNIEHGKVNRRKSTTERLATANETISCNLCKVVMKKRHMRVHMKSHENMRAISCCYHGCSEMIYTLETIQRHNYNLPPQFYKHLETKHDVNMKLHTVCVNFKCKHCGEVLLAESQRPENKSKFWFRNAQVWSEMLTQHIAKNHRNGNEKLDMKTHWESHYEKGAISLKERDKQKDIKMELQQILDTLECKLCSFVARGSYQPGRNFLLRHYCQEHFSKPLKELSEKEIKDNFCQMCNKKFSFGTLAERLAHVGFTHTALYPYLKEDSNIDLTPFIEKEVILKEKKVYSCDECGKVFNTKQHMKAHMVYHSDERPFPCKYCDKAFKTLRDSDIHNRTHDGGKPFKCSVCEKTVSQSANLWTHMRVYHTNGSFPCKDCRKEFITKWDLKNHQTEACTLKPFPCDRCGKGYERIEHLQRHKATHTAY